MSEHSEIVNFAPDHLIACVCEAVRDEQGTHIETVFAAMGGLAGFACQMSIREGAIKNREITAKDAFVEVTTSMGESFFFGDLLNQALLEGILSVRGLAVGALHMLGKQEPDIHEIVAYYASVLGSYEYMMPRGQMLKMPPVVYVGRLWPAIVQILDESDTAPQAWPVLFGYVAQKMITEHADRIDPVQAYTILMESAVLSSKYGPASLRDRTINYAFTFA